MEEEGVEEEEVRDEVLEIATTGHDHVFCSAVICGISLLKYK